MKSLLRQIKASAGSGKTYTLTGDILELLAGASECAVSGCVAPGGEACGWPEILGVTFTNRAALEMKQRVLDRLKSMALGLSRPERGWSAGGAALAVDSLLRNAGALNIRTIDSLIHLIVRLAALDLGLPPDFEPDFDDGEVFAPLLDDMAERAREGDETLLREFSLACAQVVNFGEFKGFLAGNEVRERIGALAAFLLRYPEFAALRLASPEEIAARLDALRRELAGAAGRLRELVRGTDVNFNLLKALDKCADESLPHRDLFRPSAMFGRESLEDCLKARAKAVPGPEAELLFPKVGELARAFAAKAPILSSALKYMPFVKLARRLAAELEDFQRRSGRVPASRVTFLAGVALAGEYGVSETFCRMGNRLTHILVDEFQDTSREQWQAMKPLAVEALSRGGSLTVVGDVKQAIYGWRGGDADLFDEVPDDPDLTAIAPDPERGNLLYNWRSRERIIAWNNTVFSGLADRALGADILRALMGKNAGQEEVDKAADSLARSFRLCGQNADKAPLQGMVRLTRLPAQTRDAAGRDILADLLPRRVLELGRRYAWSEITILTRSNDETAKAAHWLLSHGVPVVTQGSLLLAEQPLIAQTVALLEFLDAPDDDRAFWAVLSGPDLLPPLPGLDRDGLERWAADRLRPGRDRRLGMAQAFRADFPALWDEFFAPLHDEAGLLTPYDTVREIFQHWKVRERHPQSGGFLLRFLEVLYLAEQRGATDLSSFVHYWKSKGPEEKAPLPESMDAVRIMTIHKAKGLEAEVIIAPWHNYRVQGSSDWVLWQSDGRNLIVPMSPAMGRPFHEDLGRAGREALHLLYVAWTRAVSELHCFFPEPGKNVMSKALNILLEPVLADKDLKELAPGEWQWGEIPDERRQIRDAVSQEARQGEKGLSWQETPLEACSGIFEETHDGFLLPPNLPLPADGGRGAGFPWAESSRLTETGLQGSVSSGGHNDPHGTGSLVIFSPEEPRIPPPAWRPMHWLPRLRIFRSHLENWVPWGRDSRRRGTMLHHCLEYLRVDRRRADPRGDAAAAVRRGLAGMRLPDRDEVEREFTEALAWFAALPEAARWLEFGIPEHGLLGEKGETLRVDLLVDDGEELLAVEYKSGGGGELPRAEHVRQLENYLELLSRAERRKAEGALVYLDRQCVFRLGADAAGGKGGDA